jgi:ketosteroid isomerase-like protein
MNTTEQNQLRQLLDREAIRECLYTYSRGIDRCDEEALRSSYWPDATDQHGAWVGSAKSFIDTALNILKDAPRMVHMIGSISIVLKGDVAAVESYFQAFQHDRDPEKQLRTTFLCGRYIDKFEKRGEEWRVAARTVVYDWIRQSPGQEGDDAANFGARTPNGQPKPNDPWYALMAQAPFSG